MTRAIGAPRSLGTAGVRAFWILRAGFTLAPILFGLDKFFNWMVDWPQYLAPWLDDLIPGTAQQFLYVVGGVEIVAGLVVAFFPWIGGFLVAGWLAAIVVNLLTYDPPVFYDIALRDVGLMLGALTLGLLGRAYRDTGASDREEMR